MRRAPFVIGATLAGLAGVLGFHTQGSTTTIAIGGSTSTGATKTGSSGATKSGSTKTPSSPTTSPGTKSPATAAGGGGTQPVTGPAAPTTQPTQPSAQASATDKVEQYGYGQLVVKVTVKGSKIVALSVPSIQTAEPYSQQLAVQVIPMLKSQVLSAQSSRINGISGATYTSQAYALSLQSALDKLHFK